MTIQYTNIANESTVVEHCAKSAADVDNSFLSFDRAAIHTHFSHLHRSALRANVEGGKLVLAVFGQDPDTHESFASVRHFAVGDVEGMTAAAMTFEGMPHKNVYSPLVVLKPEALPGTRKGEDIAAVLALVNDADADKGAAAPALPNGVLPDYIIESSAGNFQQMLWLDRPLPPAEAKAYGNALKRATGADAANDIGHVWRVPGCLNWPNVPKIKRGRSRDPQPVRVHQLWTKWTSVTELRSALEPHWQAPRTAELRSALEPHWQAPRTAPNVEPNVFDIADVSKRLGFLISKGHFGDEDTWVKAVWALRRAFGDAGWPLAEKISYADDQNRLAGVWKRDDANKASPSTCASLIKASNDAGYREWTREHMFDGIPLPQVSSPPIAPAAIEPRRTLRDRLVNLASLAGKPAPERQWLVPDWIPMEQVTLLYGDGATGKSLKALQLCVASGTNTPWFGMPVKQGRALFVTAEDSEGELHRRAADISRESGLPLEDMEHVTTASFADEDAIMAALTGEGKLVETGFYDEVVALVEETRPVVLVLDTLADIYGGNEIVRAQARAFINMLRKIAIKYQMAVVVLAHPSQEGMRSGKGTSGSTGWNNSVRSRLYDERIYDEQGNEPDPNARLLSTKKVNYGPTGSEVQLRYRRGVFVVDHVVGGSGSDPLAKAARADRVFLELLDKTNALRVNVSASPHAGNYAPKTFKKDPSTTGITQADFAAAMHRLIDSEQIEVAPYGARSNGTYRLERNQMYGCEKKQL